MHSITAFAHEEIFHRFHNILKYLIDLSINQKKLKIYSVTQDFFFKLDPSKWQSLFWTLGIEQ